MDRAGLAEHFLALTPAARHLRFGHIASDAYLLEHVDSILRAPDHVFLDIDAGVRIVGVVQQEFAGAYADLGISISQPAAGPATCARLLERAWLHALVRGVDTMFVRNLVADSLLRRTALHMGMQLALADASDGTTLEIPALNRTGVRQRLFGETLTIADACLRACWERKRIFAALIPSVGHPIAS